MQLEEKFISLWNRIGGIGDSNKEFEKILLSYSEPQRHYHTLNHIKKCLDEFDSAKDLMDNPDLVEFAIWYHDIIYNPKSKDNEEKSAELAYNICKYAKLSKEFGNSIKRLILTTKHDKIPKKMDAKFLIDIDLSSLGGSTKEVCENEENIRREYFFSSQEIYREGRRKILQKFLDRERIYSTNFFRDKYELKARKNIADSLDNLIN